MYILSKPANQHQDNLPINDLFILSSDEVLLVWGDDAQGVLLARLGLSVCDVCTQVHVHRALRQCAWLEETWHIKLIWINFWIQWKRKAQLKSGLHRLQH